LNAGRRLYSVERGRACGALRLHKAVDKPTRGSYFRPPCGRAYCNAAPACKEIGNHEGYERAENAAIGGETGYFDHVNLPSLAGGIAHLHTTMGGCENKSYLSIFIWVYPIFIWVYPIFISLSLLHPFFFIPSGARRGEERHPEDEEDEDNSSKRKAEVPFGLCHQIFAKSSICSHNS